jgi:hypothetical protein
MPETHLVELGARCRAFVGLTDGRIALLHAIGPQVIPRLDAITDRFYLHLQSIAPTAPFLEGRLPMLRRTLRAWLEMLFTSDYGSDFVRRADDAGSAHAAVGLPVEFMAAGMTLIGDALLPIVLRIAENDAARQGEFVRAVNSALGCTLMVMQHRYHIACRSQEHDEILAVAGLSQSELNDRLAARRGGKAR